MNILDAKVELPSNLYAERTILSIAYNFPKQSMPIAQACLSHDDFYNPMFSSIWKVLTKLHSANVEITPFAVVPEFLNAGIDPGIAIAEISDGPTANHLPQAIGIVRKKAQLRRIFQTSYETMKSTLEFDADPDAITNEQKMTLTLSLAQSGAQVGENLKDVWTRLIDRMQGVTESKPAIATGIDVMDKRTRGGPRRGQFVLVAALRHVGKTALMRQIALNCARSYNVLCFFAESSEEEEAANTMAASSGLSVDRFTGDSKTITKETVSGMMRVMNDVTPNLRLDTDPSLSIDKIESRCKLLKATSGLDVVFVDYLQFLNSRQAYKGQTRENMIAEDARRLKILARELDIVVYCAAQLNDEVKAEEVPEVHHFRESKGPVNHADIILMMNAPEGVAHDPSKPNETQVRHLYNRKWRGVGAFTAPFGLKFKGSTQQFLNQ